MIAAKKLVANLWEIFLLFYVDQKCFSFNILLYGLIYKQKNNSFGIDF